MPIALPRRRRPVLRRHLGRWRGAAALAGLAGLGVGPACVLADDYRDGAGSVTAGGTSAGGGAGGTSAGGGAGTGGTGASAGGTGGTATGGTSTGGTATGGTSTGGTATGGAGAAGPCTGGERSCLELHDCGAPTGEHTLQTDGGPLQVWCDMELHGGGWTLAGTTGPGDSLSGGPARWAAGGIDTPRLTDPTQRSLSLLPWASFDSVTSTPWGVALRQVNDGGETAFWILRTGGASLADVIAEARCGPVQPDSLWFGSRLTDPEWSVVGGPCTGVGEAYLAADHLNWRASGVVAPGVSTAFTSDSQLGARRSTLLGATGGTWGVGATLWMRECRSADCQAEPGGAGTGGTGGAGTGGTGTGGTGGTGTGGTGGTGTGGTGGAADVLGQPVDLGGTPTPSACSVIEVAGGTVAVLCMGSTYVMSSGAFTRVAVAEGTTGIAAAGGAFPLWLGLDSGVLARCPVRGTGCLRTTLAVAGNVGWPAWDAADLSLGHFVATQQVLRFPLAGGPAQPLSTASAERSRGVVSGAGLHWLESASGAWSLRRADRATGALATLYPVPTPRGIATVGYGLSGAERAVALLAYCSDVGAVVLNSGASGALPGSDACNGDVRLHWVDPDPPRAYWVSDGDLVMADADAAALAPTVVAPGVAPIPAYVPLAASGDHVYLIANERIVRVRVR